ncbi:Receptor-like kinase [Arachis hypogaea]|nr:Receptor-like kinase [Arachis hypogaea]
MGSLPDAFDSFPKLEIIDLSYNNLNGVFPKSFTKLLNLRWLFLIQQKLTGKIEFLSSMTHLEIVWLQGNSFQGLIPDLSNCTKLQDIFLADNVYLHLLS